MAHSVSAKKRIRQNATKRTRRHGYASAMRTLVKKFRTTAAGGRADEAKTEASTLSRHLDKLVAKGIIHKNQAARRKSRLAATVKRLAAGAAKQA